MFFNFKTISGGDSNEDAWKLAAIKFIEKLNYSYDFSRPWDKNKIISFLTTLKFHLEKHKDVFLVCSVKSVATEFMENQNKNMRDFVNLLKMNGYKNLMDIESLENDLNRIESGIKTDRKLIEKLKSKNQKSMLKNMVREISLWDKEKPAFVIFFNIHSHLKPMTRSIFNKLSSYDEQILYSETDEKDLINQSTTFVFDFFCRLQKFLSIKIVMPIELENFSENLIYFDFYLEEERGRIIP
jgi:hypothetical protein